MARNHRRQAREQLSTHAQTDATSATLAPLATAPGAFRVAETDIRRRVDQKCGGITLLDGQEATLWLLVGPGEFTRRKQAGFVQLDHILEGSLDRVFWTRNHNLLFRAVPVASNPVFTQSVLINWNCSAGCAEEVEYEGGDDDWDEYDLDEQDSPSPVLEGAFRASLGKGSKPVVLGLELPPEYVALPTGSAYRLRRAEVLAASVISDFPVVAVEGVAAQDIAPGTPLAYVGHYSRRSQGEVARTPGGKAEDGRYIMVLHPDILVDEAGPFEDQLVHELAHVLKDALTWIRGPGEEHDEHWAMCYGFVAASMDMNKEVVDGRVIETEEARRAMESPVSLAWMETLRCAADLGAQALECLENMGCVVPTLLQVAEQLAGADERIRRAIGPRGVFAL